MPLHAASGLSRGSYLPRSLPKAATVLLSDITVRPDRPEGGTGAGRMDWFHEPLMEADGPEFQRISADDPDFVDDPEQWDSTVAVRQWQDEARSALKAAGKKKTALPPLREEGGDNAKNAVPFPGSGAEEDEGVKPGSGAERFSDIAVHSARKEPETDDAGLGPLWVGDGVWSGREEAGGAGGGEQGAGAGVRESVNVKGRCVVTPKSRSEWKHT